MKLALACALSHNADLLLMDEPTGGLDPMAREEILETLRMYMTQAPGRGILLSTHITSDLERIADRIVCIDAGKTVFNVGKDEITERAGIIRCPKSRLEEALASSLFGSASPYIRRGAYGTDILVADRQGALDILTDIPVDKASIEEYMTLRLRGERR